MEKEYKFEEYNSVGGRIIPKITLGRSSGLGLSAGFAKKYEIQDVVGVKLFFDRVNYAIGLKLITKPEDGMLKIKLAPKQGGAYINAKAFLIKYDIKAEEVMGRYEPKEIKSEGGRMFVIELKAKSNI